MPTTFPHRFRASRKRNVLTKPCLAVIACLAVVLPAWAERMTFVNGVSGWWTVLDGVMGGLSSGQVHAVGDDTMRFSGVLSLENNGGFSQARAEAVPGMFAGADGVKVRVRGDGRTYRFDLRVPVTGRTGWREGSYRQDFATQVGAWIDVVLPFADFDYRWRGNRVPGAEVIDPAAVTTLGFTLSDKQPGAFVLEVRSIEPWFAPERTASVASPAAPLLDAAASSPVVDGASVSLQRLYLLAIDRGVPLYNMGQARACAAVYEVAIEAMLATEAPGGGSALPAPATALLNDGLVRARSDHSWSERAWTYRRALDGAYGMMSQPPKMPMPMYP